MSDPIAIAALTGIVLGCWAGYMFGSGRLKTAMADNVLLNEEIDRLGLELLDFQWGASVEAQAGDEARSEVLALKVENEVLRKDAERYRFLRNGPDGLDLSGADDMEEIDALIDAAIGSGDRDD